MVTDPYSLTMNTRNPKTKVEPVKLILKTDYLVEPISSEEYTEMKSLNGQHSARVNHTKSIQSKYTAFRNRNLRDF